MATTTLILLGIAPSSFYRKQVPMTSHGATRADYATEVSILAQTKVVSAAIFMRVIWVGLAALGFLSVLYMASVYFSQGRDSQVVPNVVALLVLITAVVTCVGGVGVAIARWYNPRIYLWFEGDFAEGGEGATNIRLRGATGLELYPDDGLVGIAQPGRQRLAVPTVIDLQIGSLWGNRIFLKGKPVPLKITVSRSLDVAISDGEDTVSRNLARPEEISDIFECIALGNVGRLGQLNRGLRQVARQGHAGLVALLKFVESLPENPETKTVRLAIEELLADSRKALRDEFPDAPGGSVLMHRSPRQDLIERYREVYARESGHLLSHPSVGAGPPASGP